MLRHAYACLCLPACLSAYATAAGSVAANAQLIHARSCHVMMTTNRVTNHVYELKKPKTKTMNHEPEHHESEP